MFAPLPRSSFRAGQFVQVQLDHRRSEIGQIDTLEDTDAVILMAAGFMARRPITALRPAWLIVLDLNGVLGYRFSSKLFCQRPHVEDLLKFLFKNFVVSVWTSCTEANGRRIIRDVFGDREERLLFQMFRDECTPNPTTQSPFGTFKDLRRVWDRYPAFHAGNTIMVDDSEDKCSHRHNALCPVPFTAAASIAADHGLHEIIGVLTEVLRVGTLEPIRDHMRRSWTSTSVSPEGQHPTTPGDDQAPTTTTTSGVTREAVPLSQRRPSGTATELDGAAGTVQQYQKAIYVTNMIARQDAADSDEDRGRPSLGSTPLVAVGAAPTTCTAECGSSINSDVPVNSAAATLSVAARISEVMRRVAQEQAEKRVIGTIDDASSNSSDD